jgi:ubiquitin C
MQIFVKTPDDKTITLEVEASDTILGVKAKIQEKEDITPNQQLLHKLGFGPSMPNDHTLSDLDIQEGAMLYLATLCIRQIFVKTWDDQTITIDIVPGDTTAFIKSMVEAEKGIPKDQQILIFAGGMLEDGRRLKDYNIRHRAMRWGIST